MPIASPPAAGFFSVPGNAQVADTVIASLIPPFGGPQGSPPLIYSTAGGNLPNWTRSGILTHLTSIIYTEGTTAHTVYVMRPLNWTTVASAAAAAQAVINITADPGIFTTKYRYPLPGATPSTAGYYTYPGRVGNNAIAGGDYCVYQLTDGTWVMDTVSSVSTLAITMTTNVPTGGVAAGAPFFFFGISTDTDPATGTTQPHTLAIASATRQNLIQDANSGGYNSLHPGDPMLFYSGNATAAGTLCEIVGYYAKY